MQYNYPLNTEDLVMIQDILSQQQAGGHSFFLYFFLVITGISVFISLMTVTSGYERIGCGFGIFSVITVFIAGAIFILSPNSYDDNQIKRDIIQATSNSWDDEEKYRDFQSSVMRYLSSENISLIKNCDFNKHSSNADPKNTILCNNNKEKLSGTVEFRDNRNVKRTFTYNTTINPNNNYLKFTLEERVGNAI